VRIVARRIAWQNAAWCDVGMIVGTGSSVSLIAGKILPMQLKRIDARRVSWQNAAWCDIVSIRQPVRIVARRIAWQNAAWCDVGRIVGTGSSVSLIAGKILPTQLKRIDA